MELFERERQINLLKQALKDARLGEGRLVLISGEAGIGKTSLAERFTDQHSGETSVYWRACDALFTPRPLGPFVDVAFQMKSDLLHLIERLPARVHLAIDLLENSRASVKLIDIPMLCGETGEPKIIRLDHLDAFQRRFNSSDFAIFNVFENYGLLALLEKNRDRFSGSFFDNRVSKQEHDEDQ
jgi:predicted ATPase